MKCVCFNCGCEFETTAIFCDEFGYFAGCPECESSFDIDIPEEVSE